MILKKSLIVFSMFLLTKISIAGRMVQAALPYTEWVYVTVGNPSAYTQNVNITITGTGSTELRNCASCSSGYNVSTCSSASSPQKVCHNLPSTVSMAPGNNFTMALGAYNPSNISGINVEISVQENQGYLLCSIHGHYNTGGRVSFPCGKGGIF